MALRGDLRQMRHAEYLALGAEIGAVSGRRLRRSRRRCRNRLRRTPSCRPRSRPSAATSIARLMRESSPPEATLRSARTAAGPDSRDEEFDALGALRVGCRSCPPVRAATSKRAAHAEFGHQCADGAAELALRRWRRAVSTASRSDGRTRFARGALPLVRAGSRCRRRPQRFQFRAQRLRVRAAVRRRHAMLARPSSCSLRDLGFDLGEPFGIEVERVAIARQRVARFAELDLRAVEQLRDRSPVRGSSAAEARRFALRARGRPASANSLSPSSNSASALRALQQLAGIGEAAMRLFERLEVGRRERVPIELVDLVLEPVRCARRDRRRCRSSRICASMSAPCRGDRARRAAALRRARRTHRAAPAGCARSSSA